MDREPMTDKERDDALIAEARKNLDGTAHGINEYMREVLRLVREGWQPPAPEPDRAEVLACELWNLEETASWDERKTIIRRHFDELRAECEAERPAVVVPFGDDVIAAARFYADVPVAESRIVIMANAILDGAKGGE